MIVFRFNIKGFFLLLLLLPSFIQAQTVVSLTSGTGHPGDEVEVDVALTEVASITALQLHIPLGTSLNYVEGSAKFGTALVTANHQLSVSQSGETLKIYVHSMPLTTFKATSGTLLSFKLLLGNEPGTYDLTPIPVLSTAQGTPVICDVSSGKMTILSPKVQLSTDAIHFGRVPIRGTYTENIVVKNIGNEPLTINSSNYQCSSENSQLSIVNCQFPLTLAAGGQQPLTVSYAPTQYGKEDGTILLTTNAINGNPLITFDAEPYSVNILSLNDVSGKSDDEVTVYTYLQNMEPIVAAQCCIALPAGVTYVEGSAQLNASRANGHQLSTNASNGQVSFYVHSDGNAALKGSEGELFTFRLKLGGIGGTYQLALSDVILSNKVGMDMTSSTEDATLRIAAPRISCADELNYGKVPMEEVATRTFTIRNTGESTLTISSVEFSNPEFSLASSLSTINSQLSALNSCELSISYVPDGEQQLEGTMQVYSNDPDRRMTIVALKAQSYPSNSLSINARQTDDESGSYDVTINMQNSSPIVALQFDVHWVEGMTTNESLLKLSSRTTNHQVALTKVDDKTYRVFIYSNTNAPIVAGEGSLLSILYNKVSEQVLYEPTTILIDNVILSTLEEQNRASSITASLAIEADGLRGDANGDGRVTVTDVVSIVEYLQGRQPTAFVKTLADVNQDGEITITDIVGVINLIMNNR